ncbi:MAG: sulfatase, partial [Acidimicrobiia bacterium]|nr:sulfatase [Acidimicrobiia bacterium]
LEYAGTYSAETIYDERADVQAAIDAGEPLLVPTYRGLRTADALYVQWYGGDDHEYELYDLEADPYQLDNRLGPDATDPPDDDVVADFQATLDRMARCSGSDCHN